MRTILACALAALAFAAQAQTPPPGGQAPAPAQPLPPNVPAVKLDFYQGGPGDILVSKLKGARVQNLQNEELGRIEDVIIDEQRDIRGFVITLAGTEKRTTALSAASVIFARQADGAVQAVINATELGLRNAPPFAYEGAGVRR
ncbi:MAG TPA: PRC-barrel domain-containing protein [Beijerinckiaceae bacterium]|nr:PRC-barrel domain-containing protein [Beijerinckiaceae bacterium]